nr:uncharacterized protein LOC123756091 [Procambarus clarkii]
MYTNHRPAKVGSLLGSGVKGSVGGAWWSLPVVVVVVVRVVVVVVRVVVVVKQCVVRVDLSYTSLHSPKMRLGPMLWWSLAVAVGVVGRAWGPATQHNTLPNIPLSDTTLPDTTHQYTMLPDITHEYTMLPDTTHEYTMLPDTTRQYTMLPDTTIPVTTNPDTTQPVTSLPDTTIRVTTHPDTTQPVTSPPETTIRVTTHPDTTLPVTSRPDTTIRVTTHPDMTLPVTSPPVTLLRESTNYAEENTQQKMGINQELIHAEELLEKYGYLQCVPPGSEGNTRLHRLLLYRRRHPPPALPRHPPDFRLAAGVGGSHPPLPTTVHHKVGRVLGERTSPAENLDVPSARQDLLSPAWGARKRAGGSLQQERRPPTVAVWDPDTSRLHHLPVCSLSQIQHAITKFQTVYHVGGGGALDSATVGLLSSPRCGNPDTLMDHEALKTPRVPLDDLGDDQVTQYSSRPRRSATSVEEDLEPTGPESEEGLEETMPDQQRLREVAQELRDATRARHPPVEEHLEWEPHPTEARRRRRRWVEELVEKINSGEEDARLAALTTHLAARGAHPTTHLAGRDAHPTTHLAARGAHPTTHLAGRDAHPTTHTPRGKRSIFSHLGRPFNEELITWRLVTSGYSSQLEVGAQRASLALAFRMWSEVIPPIFLEDKVSPAHYVNISIGFGKRSHLGCVTEFDGLGGELGHALRPDHDAQIHMDDDEHFTLDSDHGTNLVKVAVHEIGHVLGLKHEVRNYSIMYPVYEKTVPNQGLELGWEDRKLVQKEYGSCIGAFNTVFDFLRWRADGSLTYNTYFFRKDHYWMYENKYNRTRFGDPLYIQPEWRGLPNDVDGYAHIWTRTKDAHLFFQGEHYYVYDPEAGGVAVGYPRRIAQDFHGPPTPKRPLGRTIPSDIDSVYFDKRDENLYFFKGKKVYGYDVSKGSAGCCLSGYPRRIKDEFLPADSGSRPLPRDLDAVYYSYTDKTVFFIKDRLYWELVTFNPHDQLRNNNVVGPSYVHHKWYDICDTELDPYYAYSLV